MGFESEKWTHEWLFVWKMSLKILIWINSCSSELGAGSSGGRFDFSEYFCVMSLQEVHNVYGDCLRRHCYFMDCRASWVDDFALDQRTFYLFIDEATTIVYRFTDNVRLLFKTDRQFFRLVPRGFLCHVDVRLRSYLKSYRVPEKLLASPELRFGVCSWTVWGGLHSASGDQPQALRRLVELRLLENHTESWKIEKYWGKNQKIGWYKFKFESLGGKIKKNKTNYRTSRLPYHQWESLEI